jgi:hypothetical protein
MPVLDRQAVPERGGTPAGPGAGAGTAAGVGAAAAGPRAGSIGRYFDAAAEPPRPAAPVGPGDRPDPLQRHYINLSVVALICGAVAITALELGQGSAAHS